MVVTTEFARSEILARAPSVGPCGPAIRLTGGEPSEQEATFVLLDGGSEAAGINLDRAVTTEAPVFDELYDAARRLGTAELRLELRVGGDLYLRLVRLEDGEVVHERCATAGIETAAVELRELVTGDRRAE